MLIKKNGHDWNIINSGDRVEPGMKLRLGIAASVKITADEQIIELSGSEEEEDVTVISVSPLTISVNGTVIIYRSLPGIPRQPLPLSPADGFVTKEKHLKLLWASIDAVTLYRLQISKSGDFQNLILNEKLDKTSRIISDLDRGTYFWRIMAISAEGKEGISSDVRYFEVRPLPDPPELQIPAATRTSTTFKWNTRGSHDKYHLQISGDRDFSNIFLDLDMIDGAGVTAGALAQGNYFARVSTIDGEGFKGRFSEPVPFSTGMKSSSPNLAPLMIILGVAFILIGAP